MDKIYFYILFLIFGRFQNSLQFQVEMMFDNLKNDCVGIPDFDPKSGIFYFTGFAENYDKLLICNWKFYVLKGFQIELKILEFSIFKSSNIRPLSQDSKCSDDFLEIYDRNGKSLRKYCNPINYLENNIISKSNNVTVQFNIAKNDSFVTKQAIIKIKLSIAETSIREGNLCAKDSNCANNLICFSTCECPENHIFDPTDDFCKISSSGELHFGDFGKYCNIDSDCKINEFCNLENDGRMFCRIKPNFTNNNNTGESKHGQRNFIKNNYVLILGIVGGFSILASLICCLARKKVKNVESNEPGPGYHSVILGTFCEICLTFDDCCC